MQKHLSDRVDFSKFGVPSWRIEQKYSPGVLIGNWSEERLQVSLCVCVCTELPNTVIRLVICGHNREIFYRAWIPLVVKPA